MQFNFEEVKNLLGNVVYIEGQSTDDLEPYVVCGYDHSENFLQLISLVSGKYISGLHPQNVSPANISPKLEML